MNIVIGGLIQRNGRISTTVTSTTQKDACRSLFFSHLQFIGCGCREAMGAIPQEVRLGQANDLYSLSGGRIIDPFRACTG